MNIYYSNINKFNEEIEEFVIAKGKIEKPLLDCGQIEKKMSITEFIDFINLSNKIYMVNDKKQSVIPFEIKNPNKDDIIVLYSSNADEENENQFKKDLEKINFNISKLEHISQLDILNGTKDLTRKNYFIINGEFYI